MKEHEIQEGFIKALKKLNLPNLMWCHAVNEGKIPIHYRAKLKRMGMTNGWPDITLIWHDGNKPMFGFIEFKTPKGEMTDSQEDFEMFCMKHDMLHDVARSVTDALDTLEKWGIINGQ